MSDLPPPEAFTGDVKRENALDGKKLGQGGAAKFKSLFNIAFANVITNEAFMTRFNSFQWNTVDRIDECRRNNVCKDFITNTLNQFHKGGKNADMSLKHRDTGNQSYQLDKNLNKGYQEYTKAILFAPHVSFLDYPETGVPETKQDGSQQQTETELPNELALAYGNRSAISFHLKQYKACIEDIDSALEAGFEKFRSITALTRRKVTCLLKLKRVDEAEDILELFTDDTEAYEELSKELATLKAKIYAEKSNDGEDEEQDLNMFQFNLPDEPEATPIEYLIAKYNYLYDEECTQHRALGQKLCISRSDEGKELCIRATEDIEPGEVIAAERPFTSVLIGDYKQYFCHHCQRRLIRDKASVPCRWCSNVLYCSKECRNQSWEEYHRYECKYLQLLHVEPVAHAALRLLLRVGLKKLFLTACFASRQHSEPELDALPPNPWPEELEDFTSDINNQELYLLYQLRSHLIRFDSVDVFKYTVQSCLFMKICARSGFLGDQLVDMFGPEKVADMAKVERRGWKKFIGASLLRLCCVIDVHLTPIPYRYLGLVPKDEDQSDKADKDEDETEEEVPNKQTMYYVKVGIGLYPGISLMKHSCDPVAESYFDPTSFNIVRAVKPIKTGDEISISYRLPFYKYPNFDERQGLLSKRFFIKCNCARCAMEAPLLNKLSATTLRAYYPMACLSCKQVITTKCIIEGDRITQPRVELICTGCQMDVELKDMLLRYHKVSNILQMCQKRVSKIEVIASANIDEDKKEKLIWDQKTVDKATKVKALREILLEMDECDRMLREELVWRQSVHLADVFLEAGTKCALMEDWPNVEKYYTFYMEICENTLGVNTVEYALELINLADMKYALFKSRPLKGIARNCVVATEKALATLSTLPIITQKKVEGDEDYLVCKRAELQERAEGLKKKVLA